MRARSGGRNIVRLNVIIREIAHRLDVSKSQIERRLKFVHGLLERNYPTTNDGSETDLDNGVHAAKSDEITV